MYYLFYIILIFFSNNSYAIDVFNIIGMSEEENTEKNTETKKLEEKNDKLVKIVAINKITADSEYFTMSVNDTVIFRNAEIKLWKIAQEKNNPTCMILISVIENLFEEEPKNIFSGWIVTGIPSISNFSHPVYNVFAIECKNKEIK